MTEDEIKELDEIHTRSHYEDGRFYAIFEDDYLFMRHVAQSEAKRADELAEATLCLHHRKRMAELERERDSATATERERCARIAESMAIPGHAVGEPLALGIAKKIRE